ncbi:MAG: hypothetical protein KAS39_01200, partial [Actinomycetia bacterium]|nr:hypothetical protein [Actinomycetes bacterium]
EKNITESTFTGLSFADAEISTSFEECTLCSNRCQITLIKTDTDTVGWGYKCGKDIDDDAKKDSDSYTFRLFKEQKKLFLTAGKDKNDPVNKAEKKINPKPEPKYKIGFPRSLLFYSFYPLWDRFFKELNCKLVLSDLSSDKIFEDGLCSITAEYCAPVIMSHGHMTSLIEKDPDFIFMPYYIRNKKDKGMFESHFCPYVQSHTSVINSVEKTNVPEEKLIAPIFQFNYSDKYQINALYKTMGEKTGFSRKEIKKAYIKAKESLNRYKELGQAAGLKVIKELEEKNEMGIVILGRPYNIFDERINLSLPEKIAAKGVTVIPMDMLPFDGSELSAEWLNMYWYYGQ